MKRHRILIQFDVETMAALKRVQEHAFNKAAKGPAQTL
jgi:hypothetical protein